MRPQAAAEGLCATTPGRGNALVFDPFKGSGAASSLGVNRGPVSSGRTVMTSRIFFAAGEHVYAIDAKTGNPIPSFRPTGTRQPARGPWQERTGLYVLSKHTRRDLQGSADHRLARVGGPGVSSPGHIRAFDVRTGKLRWVFHTIPWPGEFGYDTWPPDAWQRVGGANAWSGITVDQERGLVFLPTGSAAFDFWGGNRHGANLFANCLLVPRRRRPGKRRWHYQFVKHDLWDRDLPAAPVLTTVTHDGKRIDAVAQTTKSGFVLCVQS
jgi:quinoprotein glucose dehydrogenase